MMADSREDGMKEGMEKGMTLGLTKGLEKGRIEALSDLFRLILKNQLTKKRVIAKIETIQSHILMPLCCISMWLFDIKNGRKEYHSCAHDSYSFLPFFMALNCYKFSQNRSSLHRPCQVAGSSRSEKRSKAFFIHLFFQQVHYLHQDHIGVRYH